MASQLGIKLYSLQEPPGFKLGDGKWWPQTNEGEEVVSIQEALYKLNEVNFDVIHLNHKQLLSIY
jgi:predicted lysophospholipase L1 biosynthesis ABC-type transport system permease subunit